MAKQIAATGPTLFSAFLELRALIEMSAAASFQPLLKRVAKGDGHPVVVVPAFMTGDGGTSMLRRYLTTAGFTVYGWEQGRNIGIRQDFLNGLAAHVRDVSKRNGGRKVSVIGWSLGGVYARALASSQPELIRQVITLGSPFNVATTDSISGGVARLYEWLNPGGLSDPMLADAESWRVSPPVPSTAIYSEGDGVADWKYCVDTPGHETENLKVPGSHMGLTHNAAVMYAVAERLAQREDNWQPFNLNWFRRFWYGSTTGNGAAAA